MAIPLQLISLMKKYLNFFLIFILLGAALNVQAAPTCAAVFNRSEVEKTLNELPAVTGMYFSSTDTERTIARAKRMVSDLIKQKMMNDPDLAFSVVMYLMYVKKIDFYDTTAPLFEKIAEDRQIVELVKNGKKVEFSNTEINSQILTIENNKEGNFSFGDSFSPNLFNLFLALLRPSDDRSVDVIATRLSSEMSWAAMRSLVEQTQLFYKIPEYNRFKVFKALLRSRTRASAENYQEIFVVTQSVKKIIVISNQTIINEDANFYGISMKVLDQFNAVADFKNKSYSWKINDQEFSAEVTYKNHGSANLRIPKDTEPNYDQMLSDRKLTGVIAVANNLSEDTKVLAESYLYYFQEEKFRSTDVKKLSSKEAREFILDLAKKGKIDYFLREGHSESANETLITFNERNLVYKLTRKRSDFIEEVYLVVPAQSKRTMGGFNLDYSSFGQALRLRDEQNQLLYFNSSCFGHGTTPENFQSVAAPGFTPIGSSSMVDTFTGESQSAVYEFLNGIRNQLNYKDMTKNIKSEDLITPNSSKYIASRKGTHIVPIIDLSIKRNFPHE